ncbi:MAG TPA: HlyD family efflux transporter periplasmic adaptor subunit [Usitatibacter sp.]|nr:HlyD family efflux transporter periplasmic adaptor subunit [Usitatibacter sp.]
MDLPLPAAAASAGTAAPARPRRWLQRAPLVLLALAAALALGYHWWAQRPAPLPAGIAMSNGRLEATPIDVATKLPGRIREVLVREGDAVAAGQVVARMDTTTLEAERSQAEAQLAQAMHAVGTAKATVDQRSSELDLAQGIYDRSVELVAKGFITAQKLDTDRAAMLAARATLVAARSKVVESQAAVQSAKAAVKRIDADIADAQLVASRAGRVQYRLAQPGEVIGAGGKVLTLLDLSDVFMTVFLPEPQAGRLAIGSEARILLDAAPAEPLVAKVSFVAEEAQFTPKAVETAEERQKLVFRVKVQVDPDAVRREAARLKAGVPGVAYVRTRADAAWPEALQGTTPRP